MIGITLSPEQLRAAPPEVRRWIEKEVVSSLGFLAQVERQSQHTQAELTACSREEALALFQLIRDDYLACQVFFELGRGPEGNGSPYPFHALSTGEMMRHTRLESGEHLLRYLTLIDEALQRIRRDPSVRLFGFDQDGHCYVHEETHRNIGRLWREFVSSQIERSGGRDADGGQEYASPPSEPAYATPISVPKEPVAAEAPAPRSVAGIP